MSFELEKKIIIATLLFILVLLSSVVVFYFTQRGKEQAPLFESANEALQQKAQTEDIDKASADPVIEEVANSQIIFGGDMNFDRYIRTVVQTKGFDFVLENVKPFLAAADFVVANLEGPITDNPSTSKESEMGSRENYIFTFPPETADELASSNITVVNIGNNHIMNFGADGLEQTRIALKGKGVKYFGDPADENFRSYVKESNGNKIGFVNYNQFTGNSKEKVISDIELVKAKADLVVVYAHWGNEYETAANENQKEIAHELVDLGADLVIGSHPHVVQQSEEYKGKKIYYSLGNFIFDQYFEENTQKGLLVLVSVSKGEISGFEEMEIIMKTNGQIGLVQ